MIVEFDNLFISGLMSNYNINGYSQILANRRYYLASLTIDQTPFYLCIPLHSNSKYFISLSTPSISDHWKNHGLNLEKMLLLKIDDLKKYAIISSVQNNIWDEIVLKKNQIESEAKDYIVEFIRIMRKKSNKEFLSREELNILKFSSLNHFKSYLKELILVFNPSLDFVFQDVDVKSLL